MCGKGRIQWEGVQLRPPHRMAGLDSLTQALCIVCLASLPAARGGYLVACVELSLRRCQPDRPAMVRPEGNISGFS